VLQLGNHHSINSRAHITAARMAMLQDLRDRHEALKKRIHSFRVPLSARGQRIMQVVYFTVPFLGGLGVMQWAKGRADQNLRLEELKRQSSEQGATRQQNAAFQRVLSQSDTNRR
jgi:hypothetical protein